MTEKQVQAYVAECRDRVFSHIKIFLKSKCAGLPPEMARIIADYPYRRGKALRPAMLMMFCDAYGGDRGPALRVAANYQLSEDWGLGRDDLIDGSELRRGKPTLHRLYGLPKTVVALDMLHTFVFDMLHSYCRLGSKYAEIHDIFSEASAVTFGGQHLDLCSREVPLAEFTPAAFRRIAERKTAYYTAAVPCLLGAAMAGRRDVYPAIKRFAEPLGVAFQIIDDVLDVQNEGGGKFGKEPGNDIRERKRTLLASLAYRALPRAKARRLAAFYSSSRPAARAEVAEIRGWLFESGAVAGCRAEAARLTRRALALFDRDLYPGMRAPYRELPRAFMRLLLERTA